jgi:hypothetical protein
MPAPEKGVIFTGARARFLIDGVKIGWATSVSGSEEVVYEDVEVLDNIQVQEHAPIGYRVTLSASRVRIVGKTLKSQGFFPSVGNNAEEHLKNILTNGELQVQIEDNETGSIIAQYEQVKVASHNWTINARGVVGNDMTFVAIRMKDESEV